jgi:NAD(P)-dependent dehydrogenase (short-subunit alcohol dehydrogenase family)
MVCLFVVFPMDRETILVTGATEGIGKLTAMDLAGQFRETSILIHGRNPDKLKAVSREITQKTGNGHIETFLADFSSIKDVRQVAEEILIRHPSINILINNAGAGFAAPRTGKDGTETRITVNYLAPYLLTHLLLPAIIQSGTARIVNVASAGQSRIDFDDMMMEKNFDGITAYTRSKLAIILFTFDLAETLKEKKVTVNCLHPGTFLDTGMVREAGINPLGTAKSGADAIVYLATSRHLDPVTGKYFNVKTEAPAHAQAYDSDARKKLDRFARLLTGL